MIKNENNNDENQTCYTNGCVCVCLFFSRNGNICVCNEYDNYIYFNVMFLF